MTSPDPPSPARKHGWGLLGLAVAAILLTGCSLEVEFAVPAPDEWELVNESGDIPSICFGSGYECGSITRSYDTGVAPEQALEQLWDTLDANDWSLELHGRRRENSTVTFIRGTAQSEKGSWAHIGIDEGTVVMQYFRS